jgi:curved DNA-binding protein CbpA
MSSSPDRDAASKEAARNSVRVDLPDAFQREIRALAKALPGMDYYELLGVSRSAEPAEIRDAFFQRSKTFHPDRYFKKELGPYAELLNEIYKRIVAAHDVLRDTKLRGSYDRSLTTPESRSAPRIAPQAPARPASAGGKGASLRGRQGLQSPGLILVSLQKQLEQSRARARKHFEAALAQKASGDWARAAQLVELALAFDPREKQYHEELAEILPRANTDRASEVRRKAEMLLQGDRAGAAELLEEAVQLSPTDAELAQSFGLLADIGADSKAATASAGRLGEDNLRFKASGRCTAARDVQKARKHLQRAGSSIRWTRKSDGPQTWKVSEAAKESRESVIESIWERTRASPSSRRASRRSSRTAAGTRRRPPWSPSPRQASAWSATSPSGKRSPTPRTPSTRPSG